MVRAIFLGGARVHWLILFNSFLAKQLNIVCSINTKLLCPCVPVCSAKTTYVSDSANFVAAKCRPLIFLQRKAYFMQIAKETVAILLRIVRNFKLLFF